jgi:hypothetical protein
LYSQNILLSSVKSLGCGGCGVDVSGADLLFESEVAPVSFFFGAGDEGAEEPEVAWDGGGEPGLDPVPFCPFAAACASGVLLGVLEVGGVGFKGVQKERSLI